MLGSNRAEGSTVGLWGLHYTLCARHCGKDKRGKWTSHSQLQGKDEKKQVGKKAQGSSKAGAI